jgi:hypothetical protein
MTHSLTLLAVILALPACHHGHGHGHGHGADRASEPAATATAPTDSTEPTEPITEIAIAVPLAPGKTAAWQAALEELLGPRYAEYESSRKRFGLTSQTTFLQKTPMGDFALIHLTGSDVHASFHAMSSSTDAWDVKWREMTLDLHGMDFAKGERVVPKVVPAFSMASGDAGHAKPFMFLAPLAPGAADRIRAMASDVMGTRHADYVRARAVIGVRREAVFLESTAMGDAIVVYWLADDPASSLKQLAASTDPFDRWLRDEVAKLHPIPLEMIATIASSNTLIAQYPKQP